MFAELLSACNGKQMTLLQLAEEIEITVLAMRARVAAVRSMLDGLQAAQLGETPTPQGGALHTLSRAHDEAKATLRELNSLLASVGEYGPGVMEKCSREELHDGDER